VVKVLLLRNLRLSFGIGLILIGFGGVVGTGYGGVLLGYERVEGLSAWLVMLAGAGLLVSRLLDFRHENRGRPEQKWEPVADNGIVLAINGRWDEAMSEFEKAMSLAWPEPRRLRAAERIGNYLEQRKKVVEAISYHRTALSIRERIFGASEQETRELREHMADLYLQIGDGATASELLRAQLNTLAPSGHVITLESAHAASKLAQALQAQGDLGAAHEASQKAIAMIETADPYSPELIEALVAWAQFGIATGDYSQAESALKRAMECAERIGSEDKADLVRNNLVNLYVAAGRYAEAVPISEKLLKGSANSTKIADLSDTARRNRQHADLLEQAERTADAAKFRRVAETLERLAGSSKQTNKELDRA
jgi:tetratricopeptide (TPR) repeat protein